MRRIGNILPKKNLPVPESFYSIRFQLYLIIFLLSFLLVGSILSTLASIWDHTGEEAQLEIVNQQRSILLHSISMIDRDPETVFDPTYDIEMFEHNLLVLITGGIGVDHDGGDLEVSPPQDDFIRNQLTNISTTWDSYRDLLVQIEALPEIGSSNEKLLDAARNQYSILINQIGELVIILEDHMANDHRKLILFELIFMFLAIPLIIFGGSVIRRRIVDPMLVLRDAATRFGQGELSTSIQIVGHDEVAELADTFETMRSEILKSSKRLENQVAVRTHELSVAFEFSQDIVQQLDFENLLKMIVERAYLLMRSDHVSLCLTNPVNNTIEMYVDSSRDYLKVSKPSQPADFVGDVAIDGKVAIVPVSDYGCKFIASHTSKQCVSVPLRSGDRIIGAICALRDRSEKIDESETKAFALLANSATVAIENLRLIRSNEQHVHANAAAMERQRIASDLHDNLIQMLNLINLRVSNIESGILKGPDMNVLADIESVKSNVAVSIEQVRMMMGDIVSTHKTNENLVLSVDENVRSFEEKTGLEVKILGSGDFLNKLPALSQKQVFMILNEALTNIHRHAQAASVKVRFEDMQNQVLMEIEDNGKGFQADVEQGSQHYGLRIMRTRAERSGGSLSVISAPGQGTKIKAIFPFELQE